MRFLLRRSAWLAALTVILTGLTAVTVTTTANADTGSWRDSHGRSNFALDIKQVRLNHRQNRVVVRVIVPGLNADTASWGTSRIFFDTNSTSEGPEYGAVGGLGYQTDWFFGEAEPWQMTSVLHRCDVSLRSRYRTDTITWSIAHRCFENAERIRILAITDKTDPDTYATTSDFSPDPREFHSWVHRG